MNIKCQYNLAIKKIIILRKFKKKCLIFLFIILFELNIKIRFNIIPEYKSPDLMNFVLLLGKNFLTEFIV